MGFLDKLFSKNEKNSSADNGEKNILYSPIDGEVVPLKEVEDQVFAEGMVGPGIGIRPEKGQVFAPADGTIKNVFPTKHAIGMETAGGAELLLHIGINTVDLKGEGFTAHVEEGQAVKKGQLLLDFVQEVIKAKGCPTTSMLIVTNGDSYKELKSSVGKKAVGEEVIRIVE